MSNTRHHGRPLPYAGGSEGLDLQYDATSAMGLHPSKHGFTSTRAWESRALGWRFHEEYREALDRVLLGGLPSQGAPWVETLLEGMTAGADRGKDRYRSVVRYNVRTVAVMIGECSNVERLFHLEARRTLDTSEVLAR